MDVCLYNVKEIVNVRYIMWFRFFFGRMLLFSLFFIFLFICKQFTLARRRHEIMEYYQSLNCCNLIAFPFPVRPYFPPYINWLIDKKTPLMLDFSCYAYTYQPNKLFVSSPTYLNAIKYQERLVGYNIDFFSNKNVV